MYKTVVFIFALLCNIKNFEPQKYDITFHRLIISNSDNKVTENRRITRASLLEYNYNSLTASKS